MKKIVLLIILLVLVGCGIKTKEEYEVIFMSENEIVDTIIVEKGRDALSEIIPAKVGYRFIRWDQSLQNIQMDLVVNALFEEIIADSFLVKFFSDNILIHEVIVEEGKDAVISIVPSKERFTFVGWDKDFRNITKDLEVNAIFEEIQYFTVTFKSMGNIIVILEVASGGSVNAPIAPNVFGHQFLNWDIDFTNVISDLEVNAVYEEVAVSQRLNYSSYVDSFTYGVMNSAKNFIDSIDFNNSLKFEIVSVNNGGFRNTDQIVCYNASNVSSRNTYGFEVAVNSDGVVIAKEALVAMPSGGFILSGHGAGATKVGTINIGDIVVYNKNTLKASVYYDSQKSGVIGLYVSIEDLMMRIEEANSKYLSLDYQTIQTKMNLAIVLYNELLVTFNSTKLKNAQGALLDVEFLLVEANPIQIKAFWHYPLRSSNDYPENNKEQVIKLIDEIDRMGFNLVYLNTNFGGYSIYKSNFLSQRLSNSNNYGEYKDYLECFVTEAHKKGIKVSAWTNTLIIGDGAYNNLYNESWYLKGINGENNQGGMYFIDISNPGVQTHLKNVFRELAGYGLDGIEFDFIRYPSGNLRSKGETILTSSQGITDWGYTPTFINAFKEVYPFTGELNSLILTDVNLRKAWLDFKEETLTNTVISLVSEMRDVNPNIIMSAAIMSSISTAKNTYLQNWKLWVELGYLDILDPMIYSSDPVYVLNQVKNLKALVGNSAEIAVGIHPEGTSGLSGMNAIQIAKFTEEYMVGFAKFSSKIIFKNENLRNAFSHMKRDYTTTFLDSKLAIFNSYVCDLLDKTTNYYVHVDSLTDYTGLILLLESAYLLNDESAIEQKMKDILALTQTINNQTIKSRMKNKHNQVNVYLS